jgi:hypothetical protein
VMVVFLIVFTPWLPPLEFINSFENGLDHLGTKAWVGLVTSNLCKECCIGLSNFLYFLQIFFQCFIYWKKYFFLENQNKDQFSMFRFLKRHINGSMKIERPFLFHNGQSKIIWIG